MKSLNRASLDVWTEYLRDIDKREVSERILTLDSFDKLTPIQEEELEVLLKLEVRFLTESESKVDEHKVYLKKFNFYKDKLTNDERLLSIYFDRITERLINDEYLTDEDVKCIYISLMEEDMDVQGHKKLNDFYETLKTKALEVESNDCENPNCLYCAPVTPEEIVDAEEDLLEQGLLNNGRDHKADLLNLMITIHRLQDELEFFKSNFEIDGDGFNVDGFPIDDDDEE